MQKRHSQHVFSEINTSSHRVCKTSYSTASNNVRAGVYGTAALLQILFVFPPPPSTQYCAIFCTVPSSRSSLSEIISSALTRGGHDSFWTPHQHLEGIRIYQQFFLIIAQVGNFPSSALVISLALHANPFPVSRPGLSISSAAPVDT